MFVCNRGDTIQNYGGLQTQLMRVNRWSDCKGYRIEIVCLIGTLSTILPHFTHTMKPSDPLLPLGDVSCRQSCHLLTPSHPLGSPRVTTLSASSVRTLVHCVAKHSRPPDLKSSSKVSLPFAWITGPATDPSFVCCTM